MRLRVLGWLAVVAVACVSTPTIVSAQTSAKIWRIGLLSYASADSASAARWKAVRDRLRELGYVEGQNVLSAKALGLAIPQSVLGRADEVIQ